MILDYRNLEHKFSCGTFKSLLAGLGQKIECTVNVAMNKLPINYFKQVMQSRQQALKAYCPNIYTAGYTVVILQDPQQSPPSKLHSAVLVRS